LRRGDLRRVVILRSLANLLLLLPTRYMQRNQWPKFAHYHIRAIPQQYMQLRTT